MSTTILAHTWPEPAPETLRGPGENGEFGEFAPVDWDSIAAQSEAAPTGFSQKPVLPVDSVLEDWFKYARQLTEGADCYLCGAILPVVGALLGRRIWMPLAGAPKYPNIFALICGKPGDRKSTTIRLAESMARCCLPGQAFLPAAFSPESLFDEYDESTGGQADKLWIVDDANAVLTDWQKTTNGERNAARFLNLYDCAPLSENYRRNKSESGEGETRRAIPETSTSVVFGATFNVACFQGHAVRAGMARRFLYYIAERRGRDLFDMPPDDPALVDRLAASFARCLQPEGQMSFAPKAATLWRSYQEKNRRTMDAANPLEEALISRLSSAPAQALATGMIFEVAMWAHRGGAWRGELSEEALTCAIFHVNESLDAARWLDGLAHRASTEQSAEVFFESIMRDFASQRRGPTIYATRSDLTRTYCHNSMRRGSLQPRDLYDRLIPILIRQGKATLAVKKGKREVYAFRVEG